MFHDLVPTTGSTSITVTLRGIDTIDSTEDWRWCLSEIDANNNVVAYSDVWAPGTHTFTLQSSADKVQLIVVATPSDTSEDLTSYYNTKPVDKSIDRLNYPYEVQITGATPAIASEQLNYAESSSGHYHSNGGGWVDNTATVAATAYVGPNARVLGYAKVLGNAKIEDYAVIAGSATVQDNAIVSGYSVVKDSAGCRGQCPHTRSRHHRRKRGRGRKRHGRAVRIRYFEHYHRRFCHCPRRRLPVWRQRFRARPSPTTTTRIPGVSATARISAISPGATGSKPITTPPRPSPADWWPRTALRNPAENLLWDEFGA